MVFSKVDERKLKSDASNGFVNDNPLRQGQGVLLVLNRGATGHHKHNRSLAQAGMLLQAAENVNPLPSGISTSSVIKSNLPAWPFASRFFGVCCHFRFTTGAREQERHHHGHRHLVFHHQNPRFARRHRGFCLSYALKLSHRWVISSAGHNANSQITAQTPYLSTAKFQINCAWQNPRLAHRG